MLAFIQLRLAILKKVLRKLKQQIKVHFINANVLIKFVDVLYYSSKFRGCKWQTIIVDLKAHTSNNNNKYLEITSLWRARKARERTAASYFAKKELHTKLAYQIVKAQHKFVVSVVYHKHKHKHKLKHKLKLKLYETN